MSDMELGDVAGEKLYNSKDVVWVKLSGMWWPAEVQDQATLDPEVTEGLKKPLLCVVQFLLESSYLHIKSLDQIYHYNCKKKTEFLKLGFKKYLRNKNEKNVSIWPDVIQEAERRTGGNPDIINDPDIVPVVEKPEGAEFSGKRLSLPVGSRRGQGSRLSLPASHFPGPSMNGSRQQARRHSSSGNGKSVQHICLTLVQRCPPVDDAPQSSSFSCLRCDFVTQNLERYLLHYRMSHIYTGRSMPPMPRFMEPGPSVQSKPKNKKEKKRKEETGTPPIVKKRKKKSVVTTKETTPRPQKKDDEPPSALEVSQECEQILKDWDDEDDEVKEGGRTSPLKDIAIIDDNSLSQAVEDNFGAQIGKNGATNDTSENSSKNAEVLAPPPKAASCFDFDDEEPAQPEVQTLKFGQKLPRVISPEKPKSSIADILSDGRQLECFLNEVSVPQLPSLPSIKEAGISLKEQKGGKKSVPFPAKETERRTTETKEDIVGNQDLDDNKTAASEDGRIKSEEKHFLVEGPLQSKKRKGSGLTEGAEDGSAGKKLKSYGNDEPSKKNDSQLSVGDHSESVLDTGLPEPALAVLCKPDDAVITDPSDSKVESTPKPVRIESQKETVDSIAVIGIPFKSKSTISELDKQSLIDTLTYSPSSIDTDSSQKTKKNVEVKVVMGGDMSELDKQSLIDTLTHSPAPVDTSPHKKLEQNQSKRSSRVSKSESSRTLNATTSCSGSRGGSTVDGGTRTSYSRSSRSRDSPHNQPKGRHSDVVPSQDCSSDMSSFKSRKSRHSRHKNDSKGNLDPSSERQNSVGKNDFGNDKKSSPVQASESKSDVSTEMNQENLSDLTKPGETSGLETSIEGVQSDPPSTVVVGIEEKKVIPIGDSSLGDISDSCGQQNLGIENVVSSQLRSNSGDDHDVSLSLKSSKSSRHLNAWIDNSQSDSNVDKAIGGSNEKTKLLANSENHIKTESISSPITGFDFSVVNKNLQQLSENSKISLEKNEFLEVSKLVPWKQKEKKPTPKKGGSPSRTSSNEPANSNAAGHSGSKRISRSDHRQGKTGESKSSPHRYLPTTAEAAKDVCSKPSTPRVDKDHLRSKPSARSTDSHIEPKECISSSSKSVPHSRSIRLSQLLTSSNPSENIPEDVRHAEAEQGETAPKAVEDARSSRSKRSSRSRNQVEGSVSRLAPLPVEAGKIVGHSESTHSRSSRSSLSQSNHAITQESIPTPYKIPKFKDKVHSVTASGEGGHGKKRRSSRSHESQVMTQKSDSGLTKVGNRHLTRNEPNPPTVDEEHKSKKRSSRSRESQVMTQESVSTSGKTRDQYLAKDEPQPATATVGEEHKSKKRLSRSCESQVISQESFSTSSKNRDQHLAKDEPQLATPTATDDKGHRKKRQSLRSHGSQVITQEYVSSSNKSSDQHLAKVEPDAASPAEEHSSKRRSSRSRDGQVVMQESAPRACMSSDHHLAKVESEVPAQTDTDDMGHRKKRRSSRFHERQIIMQESVSGPSKCSDQHLAKVDCEAYTPTETEGKVTTKNRPLSNALDSNVIVLDTNTNPSKSSSLQEAIGSRSTDNDSKGQEERSKRSSRSHNSQVSPKSSPRNISSATTRATDERELLRTGKLADIPNRLDNRTSPNDEIGHSKTKQSSLSLDCKEGTVIVPPSSDVGSALDVVNGSTSEKTKSLLSDEIELRKLNSPLMLDNSNQPCGLEARCGKAEEELDPTGPFGTSIGALISSNEELSFSTLTVPNTLEKVTPPIESSKQSVIEDNFHSKGKQVDDKLPLASPRLAKEAIKAHKAEDSAAFNELIKEKRAPNEVMLLRTPMWSSSQDVSIPACEASKISRHDDDDYSKVGVAVEMEETSVNKCEGGKVDGQARSSISSISRDLELKIEGQVKLRSVAPGVVSPNKASSVAEAPNDQVINQDLVSAIAHEHKQISDPVELDSKESVENIAVSQVDQPSPKTVQLCCTRQDDVAKNPSCFSEPSVHDNVNHSSTEHRKKESSTLDESKLDHSEDTRSSSNADIKQHNYEIFALPTSQTESKLELCKEQPLSVVKTKNTEFDSSSITLPDSELELAECKSSNEEQKIEKPVTMVEPDGNCAPPLKLIEKRTEFEAFEDNSLFLLKNSDINLVPHSGGCSESKSQRTVQVESFAAEVPVLPPSECTSGLPKKSDRLLEGNLGKKESAGEVLPSVPIINLIPESDSPEINNVDSIVDDKSSPVPCDPVHFRTGKMLLQASLVNTSLSSKDTKLPEVSEKRQKEKLELPQAPMLAARASRWDNPFPAKKSESRPLTPTHSFMASPAKASHSPMNKVKIEIKSGLGRSCFKSPPPDVESDAKPIQTDVVKPLTAHQVVAKTMSSETPVTEQAPNVSDFDDELSALQAEIASYSESKLQAHSPKPDPPAETKRHDLSRPQGLNVDSTEPGTSIIEGSGKKSRPHLSSKAQIVELENSLAFDIPLDSIPLPESPIPQPLTKEIPSPASKVPGLSEAALLASLLKGDDDDYSSISNTVSVASPVKQSSKPVLHVAKSGHTSSKAGGVGKLDIKTKTKSNLLSPIVTSLADAPVVISNIPLPLSEPLITSSQLATSEKLAPIVIPVEPPKVSHQHQVPNKLDDTPTSRVQVLEVERSHPQGGHVGVIDPSKLLDLNDIPFVFEEDLIEEGLMPSEPSSMQSPLVTETKSLGVDALTESTSLDATEKTSITTSAAIDSEETFAIEDLVEEVVEEEPATDSTLSGDVVAENDFDVHESTENKIYEARQVRQYIIEVSDDTDPNFDYHCSLPLAPVGKTALTQTSIFDQPVPAKKIAKVVPIQPKRMLTEAKYVSLGGTGKLVSGVSTATSTPQIVRVHAINKSGKPTMNLTSADSEKEKVQVASGSTPDVPQSKEPLKLQMFKDARTGLTKFVVKPQMVQNLSKSTCKQLILPQQLKNVVKSPGLVTSNTLSTKNPSLIQINKTPLSSPKQRGAAPSILSRGRPGRQAAPILRGSSISIQRPTRNKGASEVLVSGNSAQVPVDHSGLMLTNNVLPESSSTNQVLLNSSTNQLVLSSPSTAQPPTKFVSFVVNKRPELKKPSKDLLEQALTGLDVQNDEATSIMPTATVVYGMLADPIQQRPIMTTAVQPSQVILSHDQLLTFQAPKDPARTVSPSETNR